MAELILAHKMRLLEEAVASILDCSQHALLLSTKTAFFSFSSFLLFRLLFSSLAASLNIEFYMGKLHNFPSSLLSI